MMYSEETMYDRDVRYDALEPISSTALTDLRFDKIEWIVTDLLKPGLSVLAGAPKIGKSWMVLNLCLSVAKGEPFLGMETHPCGVLYITLEDSRIRVQERLLRMAEESSDNLTISLKCPALGESLKNDIAVFCGNYPKTRLIVIDTFQKIREQAGQLSYAGDYADVSSIKEIADELGICILLVHHTRKMSDSDYINEISGTNGIAGSADTLMILKKKNRTDSNALLSCTGRDIADRSIELQMDRETCIWQVLNDDYQRQEKQIPPLIMELIAYMHQIGSFDGSNTDFCEQFSKSLGEEVVASRLKRLMNLYRYEMEAAGVYFLSVRQHGGRRLALYCRESDDGLSLTPEETAEEQALWDQADRNSHAVRQQGAYDDMPPTPTDEDAPPERYPEREGSAAALLRD